jgi:hypothetical protein
MGKKCCKHQPPCEDCPKLRKKKKKANATVSAFFCPIFKLLPDEKRQTLR